MDFISLLKAECDKLRKQFLGLLIIKDRGSEYDIY